MSCRESFWFYIIIAVVFIYILQFMTATGKAEGLEEQFFKKPGEYIGLSRVWTDPLALYRAEAF
jgi:hypothetical protein